MKSERLSEAFLQAITITITTVETGSCAFLLRDQPERDGMRPLLRCVLVRKHRFIADVRHTVCSAADKCQIAAFNARYVLFECAISIPHLAFLARTKGLHCKQLFKY